MNRWTVAWRLSVLALLAVIVWESAPKPVAKPAPWVTGMSIQSAAGEPDIFFRVWSNGQIQAYDITTKEWWEFSPARP